MDKITDIDLLLLLSNGELDEDETDAILPSPSDAQKGIIWDAHNGEDDE